MLCIFHTYLGISDWVSHILLDKEPMWLNALVLDTILEHSDLNGFLFEGEPGQIPLDRGNKSRFQG